MLVLELELVLALALASASASALALERSIIFFYVKDVLPSIGHEQYAYQKGKWMTDAILTDVDG